MTYGSGRGGRPWRRKRQRIFERDGYLCQRHLRRGRLVPVELNGTNAGVCDHVKPLAEGGTDDEDNLETICKECDREKSAAEAARAQGGTGREYSTQVGANGWPIDERHPANRGGGGSKV